jgi:lipid-A-disaccharide synthase
MSKTVFIFAGEKSGDIQGACLLKLFKQLPVNFYGVGGPAMRELGFLCFQKMESFQVMGFSSVLKALPRLLWHFFCIKKEILKKNPDVVFFIDSPDFSLNMAKSLRKSGYAGKLVQYVCPSIWAWKSHRKETLNHYFDLLLTLFEFESYLFADSPLTVRWCGHPLSTLPPAPERDKNILALFPGSRKAEILLNLPLQLKVASQIEKEYGLKPVISAAHAGLLPLIKFLNQNTYPIIQSTPPYALMDEAKAAIATSGTVTLELGIKGVPTVVTYGVKPFDAWLAIHIFKLNLPYYCIVNIINKKSVFKELIGPQFNEKTLYQAVKKLIEDPSELDRVKEACLEFKKRIYNPQSEDTLLSSLKSLL